MQLTVYQTSREVLFVALFCKYKPGLGCCINKINMNNTNNNAGYHLFVFLSGLFTTLIFSLEHEALFEIEIVSC